MVIEYPLMTEKAIRMVERENKLTFIVRKEARKADVKKAVEERFGVKVEKVWIINDQKGRKKAIVKLSGDHSALDIATNLGMM